MKDRIKQIMNSEQMSPSEFADKLQIGRAVISHILNGRNNPSLDVVTRILGTFDSVNSDWLISGKGQMYKTGTPSYAPNEKDSLLVGGGLDLFSSVQEHNESSNSAHERLNVDINRDENKYVKENIVSNSLSSTNNIINQDVMYKNTHNRKVVKIIVYYSDNTFETFNADNKPL